MEKEVMGKEEVGGAERPLRLPLCCLHWTESKSLIANLDHDRGTARSCQQTPKYTLGLHESSEVWNVQARGAKSEFIRAS